MKINQELLEYCLLSLIGHPPFKCNVFILKYKLKINYYTGNSVKREKSTFPFNNLFHTRITDITVTLISFVLENASMNAYIYCC